MEPTPASRTLDDRALAKKVYVGLEQGKRLRLQWQKLSPRYGLKLGGPNDNFWVTGRTVSSHCAADQIRG
jgi:hypothetical protein